MAGGIGLLDENARWYAVRFPFVTAVARRVKNWDIGVDPTRMSGHLATR